MTQSYPGEVQILFGVADRNDPVCDIVSELVRQFPKLDAELVITEASLGPNAKVSTLAQLARRAKHEIVSVSDADVFVTNDFLANAVLPLRDSSVGLVNCFYQLANLTTLSMRWEAIAVNADFWSQVLQSNTLKPTDFALGAVMITRRTQLEKIGGFESLLDYLADDYQLGHRIAATGARVEFSTVVVQCLDKPMSFRDVWGHQLRWARTIRACQPLPYFFSILSNVTLWALLLALFGDWDQFALHLVAGGTIIMRTVVVGVLARRLTQSRSILGYWWLTPLKDILHAAIWAASFLGNTVEWRGNKFYLARSGKLLPAK
jgi:ceramide glucosyltransferase